VGRKRIARRTTRGRDILDETDNDPVRFLSYFVAALRTAGREGLGEGAIAALRSAEPPRMEAVLGALMNEIADLPGEVTVVLDDYHLIDSDAYIRSSPSCWSVCPRPRTSLSRAASIRSCL